MKATAAATARGSAVQATVEFIRQLHGEPMLRSVLAQLDRTQRQQLLTADLTAHVPYDLVLMLWEAADAALQPIDPEWMEKAGAFSIGSLGQKLYGGLLRKASPMEFVTQSVSLFKLFYSSGDVVAVEVQPGRAVLRLVGFDEHGPLFCQRQRGGLRRAAELAGGTAVAVKHVRCVVEGDAYCEWEMRWQ